MPESFSLNLAQYISKIYNSITAANIFFLKQSTQFIYLFNRLNSLLKRNSYKAIDFKQQITTNRIA